MEFLQVRKFRQSQELPSSLAARQQRQSVLASVGQQAGDPLITGPVILGDLAAVEAASDDPASACPYAEQALDQLGRTWYATGLDCLVEVPKARQQYSDLECVRRLDDRLYGWQNDAQRSPALAATSFSDNSNRVLFASWLSMRCRARQINAGLWRLRPTRLWW